MVYFFYLNFHLLIECGIMVSKEIFAFHFSIPHLIWDDALEITLENIYRSVPGETLPNKALPGESLIASCANNIYPIKLL